MRARPSSGGAPHLTRLGVALGMGLVAAAGAVSATAAPAEPVVPVSAPAAKASAHGGPGPRPDGRPASEAQKRARRLFQDAEGHFQAGLFAEALGEYQAGYDAAALPGFLVNIAQCQRRLGNLTGALTTYRKFIMVAPDSPYVPQVRALVADLEKLARDAERERDRERAASGKPGARAMDADGGRGSSRSGLRDANGTMPLQAGKSASAAPALIDGPSAGAPAPGAQAPTGSPAPASSARWWWLGGAAALVAIAGGTAAVFALRSDGSTTLHEGSLGSVRR
jgi:hypothetical protein